MAVVTPRERLAFFVIGLVVGLGIAVVVVVAIDPATAVHSPTPGAVTPSAAAERREARSALRAAGDFMDFAEAFIRLGDFDNSALAMRRASFELYSIVRSLSRLARIEGADWQQRAEDCAQTADLFHEAAAALNARAFASVESLAAQGTAQLHTCALPQP